MMGGGPTHDSQARVVLVSFLCGVRGASHTRGVLSETGSPYALELCARGVPNARWLGYGGVARRLLSFGVRGVSWTRVRCEDGGKSLRLRIKLFCSF